MEKGVPIRSVSRSISVLQTINRYGSLSMMGIARRELLPYPTACRIVQTLLHEGLIEQEPTRKHYRPTVLVQSLAHGYKSGGRLVSTARAHMSDLTRKVGWPTFISVRVGTHMVVRDSTHAETSLTYGLCDPGFTVPLLESATGQAYLAHLSPSELDDAMRWAALAADDGIEPARMAQLHDQLNRVRAAGYSTKTCCNDNPHKTASIAVPILGPNGVKPVLTLTYFDTAMKQSTAIERYLSPLKAAADAISEGLSTTRDPAQTDRLRTG